MRVLLLVILLLVTNCTIYETNFGLHEAKIINKKEKLIKEKRSPASRGAVGNCVAAVRRFFNRSRGREYSFSRFSNARAELDRLTTEHNLNFPQLIDRGHLITKMQELNFLNTAEEKVALFDKVFPLSNFTRLDDLSSLSSSQVEQMNDILRRLESWDFTDGSGVNKIELDSYITQLALVGRSNPKGILAFWYKIYGNPQDIINQWYLDTVYRDGISGLLGKFYLGRTATTMGIDFKTKGLRLIGLTFKSIVSLSAVALDILPIGNLNRVNISPEKLERWMNTPFHQVEDEIVRELRFTANINLSKRLISKSLVLAGVITMGAVTYKHFTEDTFEHNSALLDFEVQMMANEIARMMAKEHENREEIISQLLPEEREDATMIQTAIDIWTDRKAKEIAEMWDHSEIDNVWKRYMREQGQ